ncbi:MAG: lysine-sensitive aspartokinase 3 [Acidobacteria bacterium]|nr:lysine-sensitive aspartokinase 3 [Acidobacteriota bacterium]
MIVMKFGGTSVQDEAAISRAIEAISRHRERRPAVVLSAMGKTTNRLLEIAAKAAAGQMDTAQQLLSSLENYHREVAVRLVQGQLLEQTQDKLKSYFDEILQIVRGLHLLRECTARSSDAVVSFGERMSTWIFSQAMRQRGFQVQLLDSRELVRTDSNFAQAAVLLELSYPRMREAVLPILEKNQVAIVQGFIGSNLEGVTTTIGRGGSDYTASLLGAAIGAEEIQIWTDVPGILTADPRIVPEACKIKVISFDEASELAYFGATVLHPSTLLPAIGLNIPVHVCSSIQIDQPGTLVSSQRIPSKSPVKSIAGKKGITIINVHSTRMLLAHGFLRRLFEVFERHRTIVDVVSTSEVNVSLTIDTTDHLEAIVSSLGEFGEVAVDPGMAIICVVGDNIKHRPGVASRVFRAIRSINVEMISQGASRINVTFLVKEDRMDEAIRKLHHEFFAHPDPEIFEPCPR